MRNTKSVIYYTISKDAPHSLASLNRDEDEVFDFINNKGSVTLKYIIKECNYQVGDIVANALGHLLHLGYIECHQVVMEQDE